MFFDIYRVIERSLFGKLSNKLSLESVSKTIVHPWAVNTPGNQVTGWKSLLDAVGHLAVLGNQLEANY